MRLDYEAPAGCPDANAFAAEVRARAPRTATEAAPTVHVRVAASPSATRSEAFEGSVVITDESGESPSRAVRGDSCTEVVRALALAVAMTFDPAESAPPPAVIAPSPPLPPAPAPAPDRAGETTAPSPERVHIAAGLRGAAETGVGPLVAPALGIYGELAGASLSLRIGATRAVSPIVDRAAGSARFARTAATLEACPFRWRATSNVSVVPCVAFEIGSLTSDGRSTVDPESTSRLWIATGLAARLVWEPAAPLFFELEGRANVPLTRDSFIFRPAEEVFKAPIVAFSAGFGAGVRFR